MQALQKRGWSSTERAQASMDEVDVTHKNAEMVVERAYQRVAMRKHREQEERWLKNTLYDPTKV
jgi:broad-specificity NMP kinase